MTISPPNQPGRIDSSPFQSRGPGARRDDSVVDDPSDSTADAPPPVDPASDPGALPPDPVVEPNPPDAPRPDTSARERSSTTPDQLIDVRMIGSRLRRLSRLDASVFREVRDDPTQTLAATLVVFGAVLLSALGGWLWLIAEAEGLSTGRILVREVVLGTIFGLAVWALWVIGAHVMLQSVFGRTAPGTRLLRTMGYAAFPVAASLLMVVPALGFAVGLLTVMAWFAASNAAIEEAAPEATRKEVLVANLAGFSLFVVVMSVLADAAGVAPGFFVRAADLSAYV